VTNTLGKQRVLKPWQMSLYDLLTPVFRVMDKILPGSGLSTVVIGRKPDANVSAAAPALASAAQPTL
jgi:hypothetical protein